MTKVIFGMTMSLDGFINDANGDLAFLQDARPDVDAQEIVMKAAIEETGAVVMGRNTFEMAGDLDEYESTYEFQVPIFIITDDMPTRHPKENDKLSFTFVPSVEAAIEQATRAAGDKAVTVVGGASVGQQLLKAGLIDELQIGIMPVIIGEGTPLFDNLQGVKIELTKTKIVETGQCTYLWFTVLK